MAKSDLTCLQCHEPMRGVKDYAIRKVCLLCDDDISELIADAMPELEAIQRGETEDSEG